MPIPEDYTQVIQLLYEATQAHRVKWIEKGGTVAVQLPEFSIEIWAGDDENGRGFVAVALKDPKTTQIVDNWYVEEGDGDYADVHVLFSTARRQVRGVPGKLEVLRDLLRQGGTIGKDSEP